jgi:glyoxylase-like metal-dependent hydrolase (beta-lactamase superfamily II)
MICRPSGLLLGAILSFSSWLNPGTARAEPPDISPFVVKEVTPEVHVLTLAQNYYGPGISNVVIIERSRDVVLVDSGGNISDGRKVAAYVRSITPKPVRTVVITHWHDDHPSGIAGLKETWPNINIIATPATRAGMLRPGRVLEIRPSLEVDQKKSNELKAQTDAYQEAIASPEFPEDRRQRLRKALKDYADFDTDYKGSYLVLPTQIFKTRLHLTDPGAPVDVLYLGRANTAGDAVVWLPKQRILATGDIVVSPVPVGIRSYPRDWLATLSKIKKLGFKVLIPGHGEPMTDSTYIDKLATSISVIRDKVESAVKHGESLATIKESIDLSSEMERFGVDERRKRNVPFMWTEPMVINAYKEAKGLPIRQLKQDPEPK